MAHVARRMFGLQEQGHTFAFQPCIIPTTTMAWLGKLRFTHIAGCQLERRKLQLKFQRRCLWACAVEAHERVPEADMALCLLMTWPSRAQGFARKFDRSHYRLN